MLQVDEQWIEHLVSFSEFVVIDRVTAREQLGKPTAPDGELASQVQQPVEGVDANPKGRCAFQSAHPRRDVGLFDLSIARSRSIAGPPCCDERSDCSELGVVRIDLEAAVEVVQGTNRVGRLSLGRRTTDVGDRPGADGAAENDVAG